MEEEGEGGQFGKGAIQRGEGAGREREEQPRGEARGGRGGGLGGGGRGRVGISGPHCNGRVSRSKECRLRDTVCGAMDSSVLEKIPAGGWCATPRGLSQPARLGINAWQ